MSSRAAAAARASLPLFSSLPLSLPLSTCLDQVEALLPACFARQSTPDLTAPAPPSTPSTKQGSPYPNWADRNLRCAFATESTQHLLPRPDANGLPTYLDNCADESCFCHANVKRVVSLVCCTPGCTCGHHVQEPRTPDMASGLMIEPSQYSSTAPFAGQSQRQDLVTSFSPAISSASMRRGDE
jgi:hypothetical protein